eukprot:Gb_39587 [translate_table: standard]
MTNRLKKNLPRLISEEQGGFFEVLHSSKGRRDRIMLIKLDMAKAYYRLDRNFCLKILEQFGFGQAWRNGVNGCISNSSFLVLVNGSPIGYFIGTRDIRQGCPLSLSLFILITEALGKFLERNIAGVPW